MDLSTVRIWEEHSLFSAGVWAMIPALYVYDTHKTRKEEAGISVSFANHIFHGDKKEHMSCKCRGIAHVPLTS